MESEDHSPHERQHFGLILPRSSHPELRRLRGNHRPSAHGHKMWNATWLLLDFLQQQAIDSGLRLLDVGCGWGLTGIACASRYDARVTAVDVDPQVFPYLQLHARLNQVEIDTLASSFEEIPDELLRRQELLLGADICFNNTLIEPLYSLLDRALHIGIPRILLADPGRFAFRQLASRCVQKLHAVEREWHTDEPLISWSGVGPQVRGFLLIIGDAWLSRSPA